LRRIYVPFARFFEGRALRDPPQLEVTNCDFKFCTSVRGLHFIQTRQIGAQHDLLVAKDIDLALDAARYQQLFIVLVIHN
jgi:hypothetical protein